MLEPAVPRQVPASDNANADPDTIIPGDAIAIELAGDPGYNTKQDELVFDVEVTNSGKIYFDADVAGDHPLNLGVVLAGPDGVDKPPGRRKFRRARLPRIAPGAHKRVVVRVPAAELINLEVQVEPVQERVAWFGAAYGGPVLKIGTFRRCRGMEAMLCTEDGTPLPSR